VEDLKPVKCLEFFVEVLRMLYHMVCHHTPCSFIVALNLLGLKMCTVEVGTAGRVHDLKRSATNFYETEIEQTVFPLSTISSHHIIFFSF
jgi:hypothetical protein